MEYNSVHSSYESSKYNFEVTLKFSEKIDAECYRHFSRCPQCNELYTTSQCPSYEEEKRIALDVYTCKHCMFKAPYEVWKQYTQLGRLRDNLDFYLKNIKDKIKYEQFEITSIKCEREEGMTYLEAQKKAKDGFAVRHLSWENDCRVVYENDTFLFKCDQKNMLNKKVRMDFENYHPTLKNWGIWERKDDKSN